ncbi:hypothetical protein KKJ06_20535 [Xenorhabdus bovienii]|uniref:hypothetical protein n=1 Tax=Xenorhabdus bovienii TaxID=40576 RepID=UPI0023B246B3|nr:hypothetical protein [Xenorhabdus bovienii]MDE9483961.1 hypothetical protein [Xenorhabdus bovienii]MDE9552689.1 hypothetical protein [Xenorhabdus bovienii]MDE9557736.1 hypothetical protein [Xenorhabdus bovienii]MDE9566332.1 hypothetical protein [Xenorhabdus bovienii]
MFLSFIDPRTYAYVQKTFPFFYDPLHTYGPQEHCLISEWDGLNLYIPADLSWFIDVQQNSRYGSKVFRQDSSYLSGSRFVTKNIDVEVSVNIRIGIDFDMAFLPLLSRSGHDHLAIAVAGAG